MAKHKKSFSWVNLFFIVYFIAISVFNCLAVYHYSLAKPSVQDHLITALLCLITSLALSIGQRDLVSFRQISLLHKEIDSIQKKLAAAMKHSKTFEAFRIDIENRLQYVEQETERWPSMLNQTLSIFTAIIGLIIVSTQLGQVLKGLFHISPKP